MSKARYRVKVITTSKAGEQILAPLPHEHPDGMITPRVKIDTLNLKFTRRGKLNIEFDEIATWTASSDLVLTLLEVPNEASLSLSEKVAEAAPKFDVVNLSLIFVNSRLNPITWEYWQNTHLPNFMSYVDSCLLLPPVYSIHNPLPSIERLYHALENIIRGLESSIFASGMINLDPADMMAVTKNNRVGLVSEGFSLGARAGGGAVRDAINRLPLSLFSLDDVHTALINVFGGPRMTLTEAASVIKELNKYISPSARIIWGATVEDRMANKIKIGLILGVHLKNLMILEEVKTIYASENREITKEKCSRM